MQNKRLMLARLERGLSQFQLAGRVGMKEWDISRIETGRKIPTRDQKTAIADVLRKRTFELFDA